MNNLGVVPKWSLDAFINFSGNTGFTILTPELISRLSTFVESYILFDMICVPESYKRYSALNLLDEKEVFKYFSSDDITFTDDFTNGVKVHPHIALIGINESLEEEKYWTKQHDPDLYKEIYEDKDIENWEPCLNKMRMNFWSNIYEISERFEAIALLPNSLIAIERKYDLIKNRKDYMFNKFNEFKQHFVDRLESVAYYTDDTTINTVEYYPPLLASLLDRARDRDNLIEVLKTMRSDYAELRELRHKYSASIYNAKNIGEKTEVANSWNNSWEYLLKSEFKKPEFLSRNIFSSETVNLLFNYDDLKKSAKFIFKNYLDYSEEGKKIKQLKIFCNVASDLDSITFNEKDLLKKYGVHGLILK